MVFVSAVAAGELEPFSLVCRRVDVQRDLLRTIAPTDVPGALNTGGLTISDDPNVYAYRSTRSSRGCF